ncbi:MAG: 3-dehydroquinate dehydratase [Bdellovibrionales bacterium]|jgi:3-dehydroquinate dehydratase II|nr:3-dehydroquinate dehydratase [Bdellovibrionales bacterium]
MKKKFFVINGPNLNMLGEREPELYGEDSLEQIIDYTTQRLLPHDVNCEWFQSNVEGELVSHIQSIVQRNDLEALIINPAAYSHTSVAILDALLMVKIPIVEVHLTNTCQRDHFRQRKLTARAAVSIIEGLGRDSYWIAIYSQLILGS